MARVYAPSLGRAVASSDVTVAGKKAVPTRAALAEDGEPAILEVEREGRATVEFTFDAATHPGVFRTEGFEPGLPHMLLRRPIVAPDGSQTSVFEDNLMQGVYYVPPGDFRLVRDEQAPFLPSIQFVPADSIALDEEEDGTEDEAEILFRMMVTYRLEPWIDPDLLDRAREQLTGGADEEEPRFATVVPRDASLVLDLDVLGEEERERTGAEVDWDNGITDYFEIDNDAFTRLWTSRLMQPSTAISGHVSYRMIDGQRGRSDVRMSLWDESDDLVDVIFGGPVNGDGGRYVVRIRNRIESPVIVTGLPGERISEAVTVHPVDSGTILGKRLAPGEQAEVHYRVEPAEAEVLDLRPPVVARVDPDPAALLRLLLSRPGYGSMGFSIPVRVAEGAFDLPGDGEEPLVGLLVEFDGGEAVELSPERSEAEVHLIGRLADQILGAADEQQRFFFRVTNVHASGEGARTAWLEGQGTSTLEVGVATVDLPF